MLLSGLVTKLKPTLADPIQYEWLWDHTAHLVNDWLGKRLTLKFLGKIQCVYCGRTTRKSFSQGYCFPCFRQLARCDFCVLKPELCHFHVGTCREPAWGATYCMTGHTVYLSNTSGLKVGITRDTQTPTRWIDQGAIQAIPFLKVETRRHSGFLEDALRVWVKDKTSWKKMLSSTVTPLNMGEERAQLYDKSKSVLDQTGWSYQFLSEQSEITLNYPVLSFPETIRSLSLEKTPLIEATLTGIKGQYLIFDTGVLNVRALTGYLVSLTVGA